MDVDQIEEELREVKHRLRGYERLGKSLCLYAILLAFVFLMGWHFVSNYEFPRP